MQTDKGWKWNVACESGDIKPSPTVSNFHSSTNFMIWHEIFPVIQLKTNVHNSILMDFPMIYNFLYIVVGWMLKLWHVLLNDIWFIN